MLKPRSHMDCQNPAIVLQALRNRENWAFECLAIRCFPVFQNYARNRCARNHADIEDIYQDCLANLLERLQKTDFAPDDVFAYFYTMLRNRSGAIAREKDRMPTDELNMDLEDDEQAYSEDVLNAYCSCLKEIRGKNPKAAAVLESQYARYYACSDDVEYKTDQELAEALGTTEGYIGQLRYRGREELEECIQKKLNR